MLAAQHEACAWGEPAGCVHNSCFSAKRAPAQLSRRPVQSTSSCRVTSELKRTFRTVPTAQSVRRSRGASLHKSGRRSWFLQVTLRASGIRGASPPWLSSLCPDFTLFLRRRAGELCASEPEVEAEPGRVWEPARRPSAARHSQGCQAGSMRHRLSRLLAAATRVFTLLSPPSNWARLCRRVMMAVTAFWTSDTSC